MVKIVTVFFYVLLICATQSDSFKIISKIKNYLLPTTTTTTAAPILTEFGQNDTNQETTWGEEATEENITTTSERNPEEHVFQPGDSHSYLPKGTTTDRSVLTSDEQPVYPGMPKSSPTPSNNGDGKLIADQNSSDNAWQEPTTTKGFDNTYSQDFLPVQNTTNGISDNGLEGLIPSGNDSVHSSGWNIYGQSNSTNNQSGANSGGEGLYDTLNSNVNQIVGNNEGGNLYENPSTSGNHTSQKPIGKDNGKFSSIPNSSGNQTHQQIGGNSDGGNLYEKPSQIAQQSGEKSYGGNNQGPKPENNNTAGNSYNEDSLIYPDNPLLNPTPEPVSTSEVGCSIDSGSNNVKPNSTNVPVPVDGCRRVIDSPVKHCGEGKKLNRKGECKVVARK